MEAIFQFARQSSPLQFWGVLTVLAVLTVFMLIGGFRRLRRARLIEDTPTARIRSAAQGLVELEGKAETLPGEALCTPLSGAACVWYEYRIERWQEGRRGGRWMGVDSGHSDAIFALADGSGRCVIDPEGAAVEGTRVHSWRGHGDWPVAPPAHHDPLGPYRYLERWIAPGDFLYALGWFVTLREDGGEGLDAEVRDLLRRWKEDRKALLHRFDVNRDGRIDIREWDLVRRQAARDVLRQRLNRPPAETVHLLRQPPGGSEPFILSSLPQARLVSRYRYSALGYVLGFVSGVALLAWALQTRFS